MTLDQASQALRDNPTVGGCIDYLSWWGMPDMVYPDKAALGLELKRHAALLGEHLVDALVDWMRVYNKRERLLTVPQAVRQYLGARADGQPVEGPKPKALTPTQVSMVHGLMRKGGVT